MRQKTAFITGAGGFLGYDVSLALAAQGMAVAASDINPETLNKTADDIKTAGGTVKAYLADVRKSAEVDKAINGAYEDFGSLDMLINVAGGAARQRGALLVDQTDEVLLDVISYNLISDLYTCRAAARLMIAQGRGGKIVNLSSLIGLNGGIHCTDYAAAKSGIIALTASLAKELGPHKITVNCVTPGVVIRPWEKNQDHRAYHTNLLGEKCLPKDISDMVKFLVSDKANFITGQYFVIDGGRGLSLKGTD